MAVADFYETQNELISVRDLSFKYTEDKTETDILKNIGFCIYRGEFICVMGPSGCGKSTLLKILAGFEKPTQGSVYLENEPIDGIDWHRGVVFQNPPLFEWFSVRKNIGFGPMVRGIPRKEINEKVNEYLRLVGLQDDGDKKIFELSGGMKQRVAIARSLINNPEILLMDEPFGALDALTREQMQNLLRNIWYTTGKTIFFITHDVDEALQLGTRVLIMSKDPGTIVEEIPVRFSRKMIDDGNFRSRYTEEFYEKRQHILDIISK